MIGNDIVDLKLAEKQSNWRRRGFLEKVFSPDERGMIFNTAEPDLMVWKLWSMKESAYKARLRVQKRIQLNPKDFNCHMLTERMGMVNCANQIYHTTSEINEDYVHTEAFEGGINARLLSKVITINQSGLCSKPLYNAAISSVEISMNFDKNEVVIKKNSLGIPELYRMGKKMLVLCSLSHHGRYGSYLISNYQKNIEYSI